MVRFFEGHALPPPGKTLNVSFPSGEPHPTTTFGGAERGTPPPPRAQCGR
jgi:hypothetical protein